MSTARSSAGIISILRNAEIATQTVEPERGYKAQGNTELHAELALAPEAPAVLRILGASQRPGSLLAAIPHRTTRLGEYHMQSPHQPV